jgi:hypothetical protein
MPSINCIALYCIAFRCILLYGSGSITAKGLEKEKEREKEAKNGRIIYTKEEASLLSSLPLGTNILLDAVMQRILRSKEDKESDAISGISEELEPLDSVRHKYYYCLLVEVTTKR